MNNDTVTISRAEYEGLLKANEELTKQVEILTQQIALARKQCYGSSSEQSKYDDGSEQLSFLFNEPEVYADSSVAPQEPDLTTVKEHKRQRKHVTRECDLPEDIEVEDNPRDLPESEKFCEVCGEPLEWIGEDKIRRLKIVPAKYVVVETRIQKYRCKNLPDQWSRHSHFRRQSRSAGDSGKQCRSGSDSLPGHREVRDVLSAVPD